MNKDSSLFLKLVLAHGLVTQQQVDEALKLKVRLEGEGVHKHISEILISQGSLKTEQVEELLRDQHKKILVECIDCKTRYNVLHFDPNKSLKCKKCGSKLELTATEKEQDEDKESESYPQGETHAHSKDLFEDIDSISFGSYLIKGGYLGAHAVSQYMSEMEQLRKKGQNYSLVDILVEKQILSHEKLEEILTSFKYSKQIKCFKCKISYNVSKRDINKEFKCKGCGEWIIVPESLFEHNSHTSSKEPSSVSKENIDGKSEEKRKENIVEEKITIEGYDIRKPLGKGSSGIVFQAIQKKSGRVVALKILTPELAKDKEVAARFYRESKIAAHINHINLVSGVETGSYGDYNYFSMEYVSGETVQNILDREGFIYSEEAVNISFQIAQALDYLFHKNLIHRDIKPENIIITKGGVAKLCDMGLAKPVQGMKKISQQGIIMGTPYYLSPEQVKGSDILDIRSDIYNLGATLYHMVTGTVPFKGETPIETVVLHITRAPIPPHEIKAEISLQISNCILKMMEKKPEDRFQTPAELIDTLACLSKP